MDYTEEQQLAIDTLRILLGDIPSSVFYPILMDSEYAIILSMQEWDIKKSIRRTAFSILFYLNQTPTRERSGDIEVWVSAAMEYRKSLNDLLNSEKNILPEDLIPWVAGANKEDVCKYQKSSVRSPLAQISTCSNWWTRVDRYSCISDTRDMSNGGFGCGT